ncbi:hypothetical protein Tco_0201711 [Tanacetum coccineum]
MQTKIELTLEQSQQGVSNDVLILSFELETPVKEIPLKSKPDHRFRRRCCSLIPAKSDSQATCSYSSFQSQSFNIRIVDSKLLLYQRASKSNKESSTGEIVRLIIIYVKQECNKYEHVGQEHKLIKKVKSR